MRFPSMRLAALLLLFSGDGNAADAAQLQAGRAVYDAVCIACHAPANVMVAAPKRGDRAAWARRLASSSNGIATLTDHAVDGYGAMPPKGGKETLTREEIQAAIVYMMARSE